MKVRCTHCNLEYDKSLMIEDGEHLFCCKGCQGVFHLLNHEGLDSFYAKKGDVKLDRPREIGDEYKKFDKESFVKQYVKVNSDGFSEINLIIEGIHCSACVWLNEKVLHRLDGVIEADINFTTNKARVVYDSDEVCLSAIFETIASIGYKAYPYDGKLAEQRAYKQRKDYYSRLLVAVFSAMNVMWIAVAEYAGYFSGIKSEYKHILDIAEWVLATPALFYTGWVYFKGAYYGLKNHFINMDFLVISGASLAYVYSIYVMITGNGEVYFDSATMIIAFVFIGKYLEVLSKKKAVDTMDSLTSSLPTEVMVIKDGEKILKAIEEIEVGDIVEIKAGEKIVVDGGLLNDEALFDYSAISGESESVLKKKGDEVLSGAIVVESIVRLEVKKSFENSMIKKMANIIEESINKKPYIERLANQISGYFSVTILSLAVLTFLVWDFYLGSGFEKSLIVAISVIVIACPCALGLATPIATLVGINRGIKRGIIFKEALLLESMAKVDVLLLDKTGTITKGKPKVVKETIIKKFDKNLLYSLVSSQTHPISIGIKEYLHDVKELDLYEIKSIPAKGIEAEYKGQKIVGGNSSLMKLHEIDINVQVDSTVFYFAIDGELVCIYELEDEIKDDAKKVIDKFKKDGLEVIMLTGDNEKVASKVSSKVGIDKFYHSLLPLQKAEIVKEYQQSGKKVIMAGDGINDSVALSLAEISVAMGSGAGIALEVSDVILLDDEMKSLYDSYKLSKQTYTNIKQNLLISLVYNLITIPLAIMGYVIPLVAALSMSVSSLLVVGNSLRIKR